MGYRVKTYRCVLVSEGTSSFEHEDASFADRAAEIFFEKLSGLCVEEVHLLYVNGRNKITGHEMISRGGLHGCAIGARDVLRGAIIANASGIVMAHNHPSGDPTPSAEDVEMTRHIRAACDVVGIPLLDHLVVCPEVRRYTSILEKL